MNKYDTRYLIAEIKRKDKEIEELKAEIEKLKGKEDEKRD